MPLYHADIFLPPNLKLPNGAFQVRYTDHAIQASRSDRYGNILLPAYISTKQAKVIEVEADGQKVFKIVYRQPLDKERDICLAVIPDRRCWVVKTVWINLNSDSHKTLQTSKYARK